MTREWFDAQLMRLKDLPFGPTDTTDGHWEALADIPPQVLQPAIGHALKTRTRFPVPAELRSDCDAIMRQTHAHAVPPTSKLVPIEGGIPVTIQNPFGGPPIHLQITDVYRADCDECDDSGRVVFWCGAEPPTRWPWLYRRACERREPHGAHDWAGVCPCEPTNATIQRRKAAAGVRYSHEPERAA